MVHVELGLADNAAKLRQETSEYAGLVHQRQHAARMVLARDDVEKHRPRVFFRTRLARHGPQRAPRRRHRLGMDVDLPLVREPEQAHQLARVSDEHLRIGDGKTSAIDGEARLLQRLGCSAGDKPRLAAGAFLLIDFQLGAEDARQRADLFRGEEVALHETLDRRRVVALGIAHAPRHLRLQVERQAFFRTSGKEVQVAAHGPEKARLAHEDGLVGRHEGRVVEHFAQPDAAMDILGQPEQRLQIAQPALAVLHIRLDAIPAIAFARVTVGAFLQLCGDELCAAPRNNVLLEALRQLVVDTAVAEQEPLVENCRADRHVFARQLHALIDGPEGMADLETHVP